MAPTRGSPHPTHGLGRSNQRSNCFASLLKSHLVAAGCLLSGAKRAGEGTAVRKWVNRRGAHDCGRDPSGATLSNRTGCPGGRESLSPRIAPYTSLKLAEFERRLTNQEFQSNRPLCRCVRFNAPLPLAPDSSICRIERDCGWDMEPPRRENPILSSRYL